MATRLSLLLLWATACTALEPDPVIKDGIDLGPIQSFEAERIPGQGADVGVVNDPSASNQQALGIYSAVAVSLPLELLTEVSGFLVRAKGQECKGWPELLVTIDGVPRLRTEIASGSWRDFPGVAHLLPGPHRIEFRFTNDHLEKGSCDRNVFVDRMTFVNARSIAKGDLRAVTMLLPGGAEVVDDPSAPGGKVVGFMQSSEATGQTELDRPVAGLVVRARGQECQGPPEMKVSVDQVDRFDAAVQSAIWADYRIPAALSAGLHTISIAFPNDNYEGPRCDRNLFVEGVRFDEDAPRMPGRDAGEPDGG